MDRPSSGLRPYKTAEGDDGQCSSPAAPPHVARAMRKRKGFAVSKAKKSLKGPFLATYTTLSAPVQKQRGLCASGQKRGGDALQDLALPLGMSFAAVLSKVFGDKFISRDQLPAENLSMICTSAVKESVSNIYGDKFDSFMRNFERSFDSTLKTLLLINSASTSSHGNRLSDEIVAPNSFERDKLIYPSLHDEQANNSSCNSLASTSCDEHFMEPEAVFSTNQLVLCSEANRSMISRGFNESILTTYEKSVVEQTRSNNLKEVELGLTLRRLQMKQSQLEASSYANWLEKVKICMNVSKAAFKEEKLRNQIQDWRHAELVRRCIDLLISGLILMCLFLIYGASIFSYRRITEATTACAAIPKESKSWWMPKQVSSFNSGWQQLRCNVVAITRMLFGLLMILVIAYSLLQRSLVSGPMMPVTSILLLLGVACGIAGKLCVDSLGGSGYRWLIYWEVLCLIHLLANIFPSVLYRTLYGPVVVAGGAKPVRTWYWIRKCAFFCLLLVLPVMAGLLPFASMVVWKDHFFTKVLDSILLIKQKG